jgi:RND superfamily putative drug exporter
MRRRPRAVATVTAGGLLLLSLCGFAVLPSGVAGPPGVAGAADSVRATAILGRHFPAGQVGPVTIVSSAGGAKPAHLAAMATAGVVPASVTRPQAFSGYAVARATLTDAPDSVGAMNTVERLREALTSVAGAGTLIGGDTATLLDTRAAAIEDRGAVVPAMLVLVCVVLGCAARSWAVPLVVASGAVLAFGAAFGVSALVLHGMDPSLPTLLFALLLASTVDGGAVLLARAREACQVGRAREACQVGSATRGRSVAQAMRTGLASTAGPGTATGLLTAGLGAVLATVPVTGLAQLGVALSIGAVLDLAVVRPVLVPALIVHIGRRTWPAARLPRLRPALRHRLGRSTAGGDDHRVVDLAGGAPLVDGRRVA